MAKTVIVVDDTRASLDTAELILEKYYTVITASSAAKMFRLLEKVIPDMILLDIMMPEIDGFEAIKQLKSTERYRCIPVIFLTGDRKHESKGLKLGAVDFITKPIETNVLLNRVKLHLDVDEIIKANTNQIQKQNEQLLKLQHGLVLTLSDVIENRDKSTGGHVERSALYLEVLLRRMQEEESCSVELEGKSIKVLVEASLLHDIGKIAIPDEILNKPGKLTNEEFERIMTHCLIGKKIIGQMILHVGDYDFLRDAECIVTYHHEKWDGTGYPYGLNGKSIPLLGRAMAIVDVYDALTSERPYKKAFGNDEAFHIIEEGTGKHFDPDLVALFLDCRNEIISAEHMSRSVGERR